MRNRLFLSTLSVALVTNSLLAQGDSAQDATDSSADTASSVGSNESDRATDLQAVRAAVESYLRAFNAGDAEAVAEHWSDQGEWITPAGQRVKGRDAVKASMEAYFAEGGNPNIQVIDPSIRLLAPSVAVEEGRARVTRADELPAETSYIAIHIKEDGRWKLESVRETEIPQPPSNFENLRELAWMVGTWVDQDGAGTVETTCAWTKNRNFLTRSFKVMVEDRLELEGIQVIGWDPELERIRSWIFDSDGGFGEGSWSRDGDQWTVNGFQMLQDGARSSSINIIKYVDEKTFTWASTGREVGGELLPNVGPVTVVRK